MRTLRRSLLVAVLIASASLVSSTPASAAPAWAPAGTASIHPGVQTESASGQCTANFVFYDATDIYIGQAAHCTTTGGATDTDGCLAGSLPLGTEVTVGGASQPGTLAYNSWLTMQAQDETDADTCRFNDFALVRLHPDDAGRVNPSIPFWGGPTGINTVGMRLFEHVYSYGNSSLRLGLPLLSPKKGISNGDLGGGWAHSVSTLTPGIPGDSGSAVLDKRGRALGVLSTLGVGLPGVIVNVVGDMRHELDYLRANTALTDMELALGTVPFNGWQLPLGI
jgi:hypothetical protein